MSGCTAATLPIPYLADGLRGVQMFTIKQGKSQTVQASVDVEGNFSRLQHWRVPDDVQIMIRKNNRRVISKLELNEEENK